MKTVLISEQELDELLTNCIRSIIPEIVSQLNPVAFEEKLLSVEEACNVFVPAISRQTLNNWTKENVLKSCKIGGRVFYKRSQIIEAADRIKKYKKPDQQ
jgi:hypothetical protein